MNRTKNTILNITAIVLILCGLGWIASLFLHFGGEYTNNAQIRQNIIPVSARVHGFIKEIRFKDFQEVKQGDTLLLIEDSEYRLRLAQARADYRNALVGKQVMETGITTIQNNIYVTDATLKEVEILLENAGRDYERYRALFENNAVTRQQLDEAQTKYESLKAKAETLKRQRESTRITKYEETQRLQQKGLLIEVAESALKLAELNLSYTVVLAPCSGTMSRKSVHVGELVAPGKQLFSVIESGSKWVIANYREKQLKKIKVGSKVHISADALPDAEFYGVVEAISDATGAQYSALSPDNAIGNYVKVEQRIPVKIAFTEQNNPALLNELGAGMNVECKVER